MPFAVKKTKLQLQVSFKVNRKFRRNWPILKTGSSETEGIHSEILINWVNQYREIIMQYKMAATDMKSYYTCTSFPKFIFKIFYRYFKLVGNLFNF